MAASYFKHLIAIALFLSLCAPGVKAIAQTDEMLVEKAEHFYQQNNLDSAITYFTMAGAKFQEEGNFGKQIDCLLDLAQLSIELEDFEKCKTYIDQAESIYAGKKLESGEKQSHILFSRGRLLLYENNFRESAKVLNKAIQISDEKAIGDKAKLADAYNNLATDYYFLGQFDNTISYFKKALVLNKQLDQHDGIVTNLNNLGALYQTIGDYHTSIAYLEESMNRDKANNLDKDMGVYLNNIGNNYLKLGQYQKALEYFGQALQIDLEVGNARQLAIDFNNIGYVQKKQGQFPEAIINMSKAVDMALLSGNKINYARYLDNLGDVYRITQSYTLAEESLFKAQQIFFTEEQRKSQAENWNNLGKLYSDLGKFEKAITCQHKALSINRELNIPRAMAANFNEMGMVHLAQDSVMLALASFHKAVETLVKVGRDFHALPESEELPLEKNLLDALKNKAACFVKLSETSEEKENYLLAGMQYYLLAIGLIDQMRLSFYSKDKMFLSKAERDSYEQALKTAKQLYDLTGDRKYVSIAFEVAERSKAAHLYELIRENDAKLFANIPDSLLLKEKVLKSDIFELEKKVNEEKAKPNANDSLLADINQQIFEKKFQELEKLKTYFDINFPEYYELKYHNQILSIGSVQKHLRKKEVLIEYNLGNDFISIIVIRKDSAAFILNEIDPDFINNIGILHNVLSNMVQSVDIFKDYAASSFQVYKSLLQPIEGLIANQKLIIVPDGLLGYIPFETLVTKEIDINQTYYKAAPYLLLDHAISYAYSATLLWKPTRRRQDQPTKDLLAIAPSFQPDDNLPTFLTERGEEFIDLIGSRIEVTSINKIFKGEQQLDSLATEKNFKEFAGNYKILHIATHGLIDDEDPMNSRLLFYRDKDTLQDGDLYTYELFNMQLKAELAVLSACNTGYGKLEEGEGIISLARGFLYAGVPSIVMTLWCVPDGTSVMIMEHFYQYLKDGYPKDIALQKAKLDYLSQADNLKSNPFFWAGFVNIGNTDPFTPNELGNWYFWAISAFIFILLLLVWRKIRRNLKEE
ncbi:MAG: CHAT domain-containing protein [Bacteroidales bacterium]|nr:CHAT domain-containing protein [Bacteroidales bacterium]MCF8455411.1 CHAT domain-containing protein [Bacteroidales bacterium]